MIIHIRWGNFPQTAALRSQHYHFYPCFGQQGGICPESLTGMCWMITDPDPLGLIQNFDNESCGIDLEGGVLKCGVDRHTFQTTSFPVFTGFSGPGF